MHPSLLHLHLAQAGRSLQRAKNNNYSDWEKQTYQNQLITLYERICERVEREQQLTDPFIYEIKRSLDFIYKSLEFLDSSTLNLIPYEIVEGLKLALRDWSKPNETLIIVTSLINGINDFSFDPSLVEVSTRYNEFSQYYNVNFTSRLVQINIPRALARDYLASVVHYHELGHFVDIRYAITDSLAQQVLSQWKQTPNAWYHLLTYLPFLGDALLPDNSKLNLLQYHLGEYFCDLFAAQYVGNSLNKYLLSGLSHKKLLTPGPSTPLRLTAT